MLGRLTVLCLLLAPAVVMAGEMEELTADLMALSARIERLQDISEVGKMPAYYSYYVDKAQWRSVADLFTADGTLEIGGRGVFTGRERAFEYLVTGLGPIGPRDGIIIDHQNLQPLVTIHEDGKTAEVRAIAFVMGGGGWGHVYYENDYIKEDGVWKIKKLHGPFNMYSSYDIGWVDKTTTNTFPEKFLPPPDLPPMVIYLTYPNYYIEPFHYPNPVTGEPMPAPDPAAGGVAYGKKAE
jgi:SnoaL-like domain